MKPRIKTSLKIFFNIIGVLLALFGFFGRMLSMSQGSGALEIEKYYNQHPLNEKIGIVVDSEGSIYIGEQETGSIQVYDSMGKFKYGFSFPTGGSGWFDFGIEQNKIHIVTSRTNSYLIFDKGELINSEEDISNNRAQKLQMQFNMKADNIFAINNKVYEILPLNIVSIKDISTGKIEKIHLNAPIWPFSSEVFWLIVATGMGLILILNRKLFC